MLSVRHLASLLVATSGLFSVSNVFADFCRPESPLYNLVSQCDAKLGVDYGANTKVVSISGNYGSTGESSNTCYNTLAQSKIVGDKTQVTVFKEMYDGTLVKYNYELPKTTNGIVCFAEVPSELFYLKKMHGHDPGKFSDGGPLKLQFANGVLTGKLGAACDLTAKIVPFSEGDSATAKPNSNAVSDSVLAEYPTALSKNPDSTCLRRYNAFLQAIHKPVFNPPTATGDPIGDLINSEGEGTAEKNDN